MFRFFHLASRTQPPCVPPSLTSDPLASPRLPWALTWSNQVLENMLEVWERNRMGPVLSFLLLLSQGIKFQSQQLKERMPRIAKIPWTVF